VLAGSQGSEFVYVVHPTDVMASTATQLCCLISKISPHTAHGASITVPPAPHW
jgi:hypothetical protein